MMPGRREMASVLGSMHAPITLKSARKQIARPDRAHLVGPSGVRSGKVLLGGTV